MINYKTKGYIFMRVNYINFTDIFSVPKNMNKEKFFALFF